jgi:hypothetical protein
LSPGRAILWSLAALLGLSGAGNSQVVELTPEELQAAEQELRATLAGPGEEAFAQVLTQVRLERDPLIDTLAVYDISIYFDPDRYRNPHLGVYPLDFADQFIAWGKRLSLYTLSSSWKSGRFYLRDISTGREAWIFTEDARLLYGPAPKKMPSTPADWLALIHAVKPHVDLRAMGYWLSLMRHENREQVIRRLQEEKQRAATFPGTTP